jgi:hypothetical protein
MSGDGLDSTEYDAAGREHAAARRVVIAAGTTSTDPSPLVWWAHRSGITLVRTTPRSTTSPRTSIDSTEWGGNRSRDGRPSWKSPPGQ